MKFNIIDTVTPSSSSINVKDLTEKMVFSSFEHPIDRYAMIRFYEKAEENQE